MKDKRLSVSAIKEGTVIDHIPASVLFKVVSLLNLEKLDTMITIGNSLGSEKLGKKGIIKLSKVFFQDNDINKIALVAPCAKLNIIRNFEVVEKRLVSIPDEIVGSIKCVNPKCITNNQDVTTRFEVVSKSDVKLKCHYCGKTGLVKDIEDMSSAAQRSILATIDHVIPISKGGKRFDVSNCVVACYKCNSKKKDNVGVAQLAERRPSKSEVVGS